ncbi:glycoside hydrolase family 38 C-terminal domain-containing protein [Trebonia sp.]|uniref:glycoside hydrolase family 38 N-terminal domain-containing protein n=1 Tax=Trebonia sp. TaxID=2767075 RepID=UPI00260CE4E0|nr:glycoside hydrolase family 38 C-terminal domain-containing protein [Trebonia sp.]
MRITGVESTDLFQGTTSRPLQVIRVTVESTRPSETGAPATLRIAGPWADTPAPFGITGTEPGESRTYEVAAAVTGAPGTLRPVTVIAETANDRIEHAAQLTVAEPGWTMWMVSHFHYDPVWWSTQGQFTEARLVLPDEDGKLPDARSAFELVRLHLEKARRDPDYKFVLAEIDYLKPHFDAFPADRADLRALLDEGRAELVGGTYNEPNANLTGAETTIRNAVYGVGFQRGVLGADPRSAWMLDAFGHDPGFPGLMAAAGLTSSSWARGPFHQWGPDDNTRMQFPAEFEWLSPDGGGLLTSYMANHYGAGWIVHTAADLASAEQAAYEQFRSLAAVAATRNVMLPVGSDHVIPARWVTDIHRSWNSRYVWPRFVTAIPRDFFDAVRAEAAAPASGVWITPQTRDMNPVYTGKDVSYADTKQANRAGETAVAEGERLATLAWLDGAPYPAESLDKAWRQLAYGAHHDAVTGTESDQVYLDLLAGWREAWQRGDAARRDAIDFIASRSSPARTGGGPAGRDRAIIVCNGLARERDGMARVTVRIDEPGTPWLAVCDASDGSVLDALAEGVRRHDDGSLAEITLTFRAAGVPALGYRRYLLRPLERGAGGWADDAGTAIENGAFLVTADPARGGTLAITDTRAGRDVLRGPGNELVLQEEYDKHPRWGEGPWHLSPKGPGQGSAGVPATVRAQHCPVGRRLLATFRLGDLEITQETLLWHGSDLVEFRTHVSGSIGKDHLLRVRFPADVPGGLPVYQTATAVIGRPFGVPEADTATHWWTLDNPAHHWFGLGSVARVAADTPEGEVPAAIGVAEVITPDTIPNEQQRLIRDLVVCLAGTGVTATCSRAAGPRYGSVDLDSNLPDFRIALGGPEENAFTAEVLAASDPAVAKRLAALVSDRRAARLWVPAARTRAEAFAPDADLRGPRDLPVLIVATADPAALERALGDLLAEVTAGSIRADAADGAPGDRALAEGAVALFNQGTPSAVVTPDGTLWMSLMRACSSWPCGVWIDGDRRTAPDGSSFAWQHWSHTFAYALACSGDGWREGRFNARAEHYNHELIAVVSGGVSRQDAADASPDLVSVSAPNVSLTALKPFGNPLAAGRPGTPASPGLPGLPGDSRDVTVRLRETDGRPALAALRFAGGIEAAWRTDILEESLGSPLTVTDGVAYAGLSPFETVTLAVRPARAGRTGTPDARSAAPAPPEPAQPVYTRYWLHGKGPAPAGNVPVAVHFTPTRVTLAGVGAGAGNQAGRTRLTVACGPEPASGGAELIVPAGLVAEIGDAPAGSGSLLRYDLPGGGFATWDVTVRALPAAAAGRYFVAARIGDELGQQLEDAALVTVGEPGGPDASLPPEELFFRLQSDVQALAGEADVEVLTPGLRLAPGHSGELTIRVASHLASPLRGEVQLISPFGSWEAAGPWTRAVHVAPGGEATVSFGVALPATAVPGWQSWLLVKLMYFGRVRYSEAVPLTVI